MRQHTWQDFRVLNWPEFRLTNGNYLLGKASALVRQLTWQDFRVLNWQEDAVHGWNTYNMMR